MQNVVNIIGAMFFLICSCDTNTNVRIKEIKRDSIPNDKIILYTEDSISKLGGEPFARNLGKLMRLPEMLDEDKKTKIRMWLWEAEKKYVVDIVDGTLRECTVTEFNIKKKDSNNYIIIHRKLKNLQPSSGWDKFLLTLNNYEITSLKPGKTVNEYKEHLTEMSTVQFEVATFGKYRYFEYVEPSFYRYIDSGSKNIYDFLLYFNKQMDVEVYNPPKELFVKPKRN